MRVEENAYFAGSLEGRVLVPSTGCVLNAHVNAGADVAYEKLEHLYSICGSQDIRQVVKGGESVVHVVHGVTGELVSFEAGLAIANTGAATIDLDLLKNGVSVLADPIEIDNADVAYDLVAGNIATIATLDGDVISVRITSLSPESTMFEFEEEFLKDAGDTLPDIWGVDAETVNSTEDYVTDSASGVYSLINSADTEAQSTQLFSSDNLWIDLMEAPIIEWRVKFDLTGVNMLGSADQRFVIGVCSEHTNAEDALDSTTVNAWFRLEGASANIYVEADDNTTNTDDQDSSFDVVEAVWMSFVIDFTDLSDVKFYVNGVEQTGAAVSMAGIVASTLVQPIACLQRDGGAEEEKVYIDSFKVTSGRQDGTQGKGLFYSLVISEKAQ